MKIIFRDLWRSLAVLVDASYRAHFRPDGENSEQGTWMSSCERCGTIGHMHPLEQLNDGTMSEKNLHGMSSV